MAYQMTPLPPPPQRLTRKFYKSKNSSNFLSPTSQVELLGWWGGAYGMPDDTLSHHQLKLWQENFLHPKSQEVFSQVQNVKKFSKSNKSSWALGWWWGGMAYQMTHLPPPPQRLTRKFYKSKNSSNFQSPTSQEFSKSNKSRNFLSPTSQEIF